MLNSKKYIITGFVGLVLVGVSAFFLMRENKLPERITSPIIIGNQGLFSLAPSAFDQLVYIETDESLKSSMTQYIPTDGLSGNFQSLIEQVDAALVVQYGSGEKLYNLLFLQGERIDISVLQELGVIATGKGFETRKINKNTWVYGAMESLDWRENSKKTLLNNDISKKYRVDFHDGGYNIGFLSKPLAGGNISPLVNQFSEKLEHTSVMTHLDTEKSRGKLTLQFTEGVINTSSVSFSPQFSEYMGAENLLFLELGDVLGFMGIGKEKFMSLLPLLFGEQGNVYSKLLNTEDYENIYTIFQKQIGILVEPSLESPVGLSLYLLFNDVRAFDIFKKLSPLLKTTLSGFSGSGDVVEKIDETHIKYTINSGGVGTGNRFFANIEKQKTLTILSLFGGVLEKGTNVKRNLFYTSDTAISFIIDGKQLQKIGGPRGIVAEENPLGQGIISGDIEGNKKENQVIVNFRVEKE